jgi:hypothetical protein
MNLSPEMADVLTWCADAPPWERARTGEVRVSYLVEMRGAVKFVVTAAVNRRDRAAGLNVIRASLSRTLRRLWRIGYLELFGAWGNSATETHEREHERALGRLEAARADPAGEYARAVAMIGEDWDWWKSPEAYLAFCESRVSRPPSIRVTYVALTKAGIAVNSVGRSEVSTRMDLRRLRAVRAKEKIEKARIAKALGPA